MEIKLIGLDLDGTVFNNKKEITTRTKDAILRAIDAGVIIVPTTGRPRAGLPKEFIEIPSIRYAITSNGASIIDLSTNEAIYQDLMSAEKAYELLVSLPTDIIMAEVYIKGFGYAEQNKLDHLDRYTPSEQYAAYIRNSRNPVDSICRFVKETQLPIEKIHLLFAETETKTNTLKQLQKISDIYITTGISNNLEINSKTANKGNGLLELGKILGIKQQEIMACGDSGNDYDMIVAAGLGIAMENADDRIKAAADFITTSNEEDGVAYAIERFVNIKNKG